MVDSPPKEKSQKSTESTFTVRIDDDEDIQDKLIEMDQLSELQMGVSDSQEFGTFNRSFGSFGQTQGNIRVL